MPKYFRIKQAVLERIASGAWTPGAMIPSEVELCRDSASAGTTARKAVSDLAHEGRLVVVQGKGTFVATPKVEEHFVQRAFGIHEDMQRRGITLTTQVLRQEVTEPSPESTPPAASPRRRRALHRPAPLCRRRADSGLVDDRPVRPVSRPCDGESHGVLVVRASRDRYGLAIARGERRLESVAAGGPDARLLDVALGSPLLLLDSVAYTAGGRPFEHSVALQRGDRTTVEVEFFETPDDSVVGQRPARPSERTAAELIADSLAETRDVRPPNNFNHGSVYVSA